MDFERMKKNESGLEFVLPAEEHRGQVEEYKRKFLDERRERLSSAVMPGCGNLEKMGVDEWLWACEDWRVGANLPEGFVPATQYLAIRKEDGKLIGMFQIRHHLNDFLEKIGGHIGYSVAPDERRKGYATDMLNMGIDKCKEMGIEKIVISCVRENKPSAAVIKKCGGKFEGRGKHEGKVFERYSIIP